MEELHPPKCLLVCYLEMTGSVKNFSSRPCLSCSVHVKTLKMVESGMSPYILKHVFLDIANKGKDVPLSSVKMERKWNFFLIMFGT